MILLAVDTCTAFQSLAVAERGRTLAESLLDSGGRHSETLLAALSGLMDEAGLAARDVAAVAVTTGPGTFMGLRIGLATAKGLALASGIPLAGFSTLRVLAEAIACESAAAEGALVCALLDAGRGQLYRGLHRVVGAAGGWRTAAAGAEALVDPREALRGLPPGAVVGGEGLGRAAGPGHPDRDLRLVTSRLALAPVLARRASAMLASGDLPAGAPEPNYIRAVDAKAAGA